MHIGEANGEALQMKVLPKLAPDGRAFDMEIRLELAPGAASATEPAK